MGGLILINQVLYSSYKLDFNALVVQLLAFIELNCNLALDIFAILQGNY
jgi:hypothetical protein